MTNERKNWMSSNLKVYFGSVSIALVITLISFYLNGIYPFGSFSVASGDMVSLTVPIHMMIREIVFGNMGVFYNFSAALGTDIFAFMGGNLLSPLVLLSLFIMPENMFLYMSVFLCIRLVLIAFTTALFLSKCFKNLSPFWKISLSVLYATSGYALFSYFMLIWLDLMILFPVILLGIYNIYTKSRAKLYTLTLLIAILLNFYIAILMITLLFLLIGAIHFSSESTKVNKNALLQFSLATIVALLLASPILVPNLIQVLASPRLGGHLLGTLRAENTMLFPKANYHLFSISLFSLSLILYANYVRFLKYSKSIFFVLSICLIPIFFEGTNLILHLGSYQAFPFRAGFVYQMVLVCVIAYIISNVSSVSGFENNNNNIDQNKYLTRNVILSIASILCLFSGIYAAYTLKLGNMAVIKFFHLWRFDITEEARLTLLMALFFTFALLFSWFVVHKKKVVLIGTIFVIQSFMSVYLLVDPLTTDEGLADAHRTRSVVLRETFDDDNYYRIKDAQRNMPHNNVFLSHNIPSVALNTSWTPTKTVSMWRTLGYTVGNLQTTDLGGSLFTDSIVGYRYILSSHALDSSYYTFTDHALGLEIYSFKGYIPIGNIFIEQDLIESFGNDFDGNVFDFQNAIFHSLGYDQNLFDIIRIDDVELINMAFDVDSSGFHHIRSLDSNPMSMVFSTYATGEKRVYLDLLASADPGWYLSGAIDRLRIYVYSEERTTQYSKLENPETPFAFPKIWNSGLLYIGTFEDEEVLVRVEVPDGTPIVLKNVALGLLNLDIYDQFISDYTYAKEITTVDNNTMSICLQQNENNGLLLVPIMHQDGIIARIDGRRVETHSALGHLTGVYVSENDSVLEINYVSPGLILGILISIFTFIVILASYFIFLKKQESVARIVVLFEKIVNAFYLSFLILAVFIIYLIPILIVLRRLLLRVM